MLFELIKISFITLIHLICYFTMSESEKQKHITNADYANKDNTLQNIEK